MFELFKVMYFFRIEVIVQNYRELLLFQIYQNTFF